MIATYDYICGDICSVDEAMARSIWLATSLHGSFRKDGLSLPKPSFLSSFNFSPQSSSSSRLTFG